VDQQDILDLNRVANGLLQSFLARAPIWELLFKKLPEGTSVMMFSAMMFAL